MEQRDLLQFGCKRTWVQLRLWGPMEGARNCLRDQPALRLGLLCFDSVRPSSKCDRSSRVPISRLGLSRWHGGRYRVDEPRAFGHCYVVWVMEKGDSCDPLTKNDAGRTPASQLFCDHYAQLPTGCG